MSIPALSPLTLLSLATDPSTGSVGDHYFNTTTSAIKVCTNSTGPVWAAAGSGSKVTQSTTPPTTPVPVSGDLWWDTSIGTLKIYYNDGTTSQWVDASMGSIAPSSSSGGGVGSALYLFANCGGF